MYNQPNLNQIPIVSLGEYHKYRLHDNSVNPNITPFSKRILSLKIDLSEYEINKFASEIDSLLESNVAICYVPSCDSTKDDSGVRRLARKVALKSSRIDATECIVRHTTIEKLAKGGNRSKQVHLSSLRVNNENLIRGKKVLIIDDVTTTNNSLLACKELLLEAEASEVYCLALGQTVSD